ncbi:hypothetical protein [Anaerocolumna xylanovorans]|uniref:Uncharacterized protein n=1 Tax=Anaerocolumna xylanovorans DSM 12503 TaxID=1121345 RepID=A0A1M7YMJ3_9FIRM|nr:hypothetical protein [Anaerocolumna xylanovorans]SHO53834.1 hypothetical protein SAMN02745217_04312 [Anaerocolumna xylanovorans DSM 12503]
MSEFDKKEESGMPSKREEFPVINPSFIPEPGYDNIDNIPKGEEYPSYQDPIPIDKPTEIGGNSIKEF